MVSPHRTLLPPGWQRPRGYANGIVAQGHLIFTGGVIGWDKRGQLVSPSLVGQFRQILLNTLAILSEAGAGPEHVVRMTWYVTSVADYLDGAREIGSSYRELFGKHYPAMAVVEVSALVETGARIEIETTAVVPGAILSE